MSLFSLECGIIENLQKLDPSRPLSFDILHLNDVNLVLIGSTVLWSHVSSISTHLSQFSASAFHLPPAALNWQNSNLLRVYFILFSIQHQQQISLHFLNRTPVEGAIESLQFSKTIFIFIYLHVQLNIAGRGRVVTDEGRIMRAGGGAGRSWSAGASGNGRH